MPVSSNGGLVWEHLIAIVLGLYPAMYLAVLCHEIGHVVVGRLAGFTITSFGLGTQDPFFKARMPGGTIFYLCRRNPLLGICWTSTPELLPTRSRSVFVLLGGAIMNLLLVVPSVLLWRATQGGFWLVFATLNLILGVTNLIPHTQQFRGSRQAHASDGLQAVKIVLSRHSRIGVPSNHTAYRPLWEAVGDLSALRSHLCTAALTALSIHETESAGEYITTAEGLPHDENDDCVLMLRGLWHALLQENAAARTCLQAASERFIAKKQLDNLFYTNLFLYSTYVDARLALTELETMAASLPRTLARHPMVIMTLAAERLRLFFRLRNDDIGTLETYVARFEASRRAMRSDAIDADIYAGIAGWRQKHSDTAGARIAWEQAFNAMEAISTALSADPELQGRYQMRVTAQLMEAGVLSPFADAVPIPQS